MGDVSLRDVCDWLSGLAVSCHYFTIACRIEFRSLCSPQVGGLASENVRWAEAVANFRHQERTLCGDVLLITAFVSYVGYFTKRYRHELMDNTWKPYLSQLKVGLTTELYVAAETFTRGRCQFVLWPLLHAVKHYHKQA